MRVWKMTLSRESAVTDFDLPHGAMFLGGMLQPGPEGTPVPTLWALLDTEAPKVTRSVLAVVDNEPIADELAGRLEPIATLQAITPSGQVIVVHTFEITPVKQ